MGPVPMEFIKMEFKGWSALFLSPGLIVSAGAGIKIHTHRSTAAMSAYPSVPFLQVLPTS